jgi:hypothetical protein
MQQGGVHMLWRKLALLLASGLLLAVVVPGPSNAGGLLVKRNHPEVLQALQDLEQEQTIIDARLSDVEKLLGPVDGKTVFVTSRTFTGNLGGLEGADAKCQAAADNAGLTGLFLAWLSTSPGPILGQPASGPLHRFTRHAVPYVRTDGVKVADHFGDLADGTLDQPIDRTEFATQLLFADEAVWSSTIANGAPASADSRDTCENWTTDAPLTTATSLGDFFSSNFAWSAPGLSTFEPCGQRNRLYCVEQ